MKIGQPMTNVLNALQDLVRIQARIEDTPLSYEADVRLTPREIHTIQAIGDREGINVKNLGNHFGVTKSASSQLVSRLADRGFVDKRPAPDNNKEIRLVLTDKGRLAQRVHELTHARYLDDLAHRLERFSKAELETVASFLATVRTCMTEHANRVPRG